MKIIIILQVIIVLLTSQLSAQTKNDYLLKSKNQKTTAWILLGGGLTLDFIGTYELFMVLTKLETGSTIIRLDRFAANIRQTASYYRKHLFIYKIIKK